MPNDSGMPDRAESAPAEFEPGLSKDDQVCLDESNRKLQPMRDFVGEVARGRTTGLMIYGPPGTGKTWTVIDELQQLKVGYRLFNSRVSGRGLFDVLRHSPSLVHVLDDCEPLLGDKQALGVLRSALGTTNAGGRADRLVSWVTAKERHDFAFSGGVILIGNRPWPNTPEVDAIRTRVTSCRVEFTDAEMRARLRHMAMQGFRHGDDLMDARETIAVCEYLFQCRASDGLLSLRLLSNACQDYLAWRNLESGCGWQDLVRTRIAEQLNEIGVTESLGKREEMKLRERELVQKILAMKLPRSEQVQLWAVETHKSQAAYYRRRAEVLASTSGDDEKMGI